MVSVNISEYRSLSNSKYQTQLLNLKIFIVFMLQKTHLYLSRWNLFGMLKFSQSIFQVAALLKNYNFKNLLPIAIPSGFAAEPGNRSDHLAGIRVILLREPELYTRQSSSGTERSRPFPKQ